MGKMISSAMPCKVTKPIEKPVGKVEKKIVNDSPLTENKGEYLEITQSNEKTEKHLLK